MYEKVQGENENRRAYIPDSLLHKSHKSFLWILASKPGLHQDKHTFGSSLNRREERH